MSSTNSSKRYLSLAAGILLLLLVLIGALQSGPLASLLDSNGFIFVLVGGLALVLISFPGTEIWHAFRNVAGTSGSDAELRSAAHFWEAAGRAFWILGGVRSVLSIIIGFINLRTVETASFQSILPMLINSLLSIFYGSLLAAICFVPCWRLMGKLQGRPSAPDTGRSDVSFWRFGTVLGYVLFLAVLISTTRIHLNLLEIWTVYRPPLLVVLGGTLALMLFVGGNSTRLTSSAAFAGMGLIGSLMGFVQMLRGMTQPTPQGIAQVAGAIAFVVFSCFTALLGMALIGAPMEDRAIRIGRVGASSGFSRVSWYVFPLLSLIFLVLVFNMIIAPLPPH